MQRVAAVLKDAEPELEERFAQQTAAVLARTGHRTLEDLAAVNLQLASTIGFRLFRAARLAYAVRTSHKSMAVVWRTSVECIRNEIEDATAWLETASKEPKQVVENVFKDQKVLDYLRACAIMVQIAESIILSARESYVDEVASAAPEFRALAAKYRASAAAHVAEDVLAHETAHLKPKADDPAAYSGSAVPLCALCWQPIARGEKTCDFGAAHCAVECANFFVNLVLGTNSMSSLAAQPTTKLL